MPSASGPKVGLVGVNVECGHMWFGSMLSQFFEMVIVSLAGLERLTAVASSRLPMTELDASTP